MHECLRLHTSRPLQAVEDLRRPSTAPAASNLTTGDGYRPSGRAPDMVWPVLIQKADIRGFWPVETA